MNLDDEIMLPTLNESMDEIFPPLVDSNVRKNLFHSPSFRSTNSKEFRDKRVIINEDSNEMLDGNNLLEDSRSLEDSGEKSSGDSGESDIESNSNSFWSPAKSLNGSHQVKSSLPSSNSGKNSGRGKGKRNLSISIPKTPPPERMMTRSKGGGLFSPLSQHSPDSESLRKSADASTPSRGLRREKSREVLKMSELEEGSIIIPCFVPQFTTPLTPKSSLESIVTPTWRSVDIESRIMKELEDSNSPMDESRDGHESSASSSSNTQKEKSKLGFSVIEAGENEEEMGGDSSSEDTSDEAYCKYHFCRELVERNLMGYLMHKMKIPEEASHLPEEFFRKAGELYVRRKRKKTHAQSIDVNEMLQKQFEKLRTRYSNPEVFLERTWKQEDEEKYLHIGSPRALPTNRLKRSHSASSLNRKPTAFVRYLRDCPSSQETEDHFDVMDEEMTVYELQTGKIVLKTKRPKKGKKKRSESHSSLQKSATKSEKTEEIEAIPATSWQPCVPLEPLSVDPTLGRERLVVRLKRIISNPANNTVPPTQPTSSQNLNSVPGDDLLKAPLDLEPKKNTNLDTTKVVLSQESISNESKILLEKKLMARKLEQIQKPIPITPFISQ
eukprot:TRINITY_DN4762_c0_g1_i1.p1 TRINITY_DN4762_c0_g1~~TRINITY_DN4762_c0_g1_i1.p1  ORF type:complete len:611 (-),score=222.68 TRINITY_DN4762_c0_g1_i1:56-1888(-)